MGSRKLARNEAALVVEFSFGGPSLDDGNAYKKQIVESKAVLLKGFPRVTTLEFLSDDNVSALQAARRAAMERSTRQCR